MDKTLGAAPEFKFPYAPRRFRFSKWNADDSGVRRSFAIERSIEKLYTLSFVDKVLEKRLIY